MQICETTNKIEFITVYFQGYVVLTGLYNGFCLSEAFLKKLYCWVLERVSLVRFVIDKIISRKMWHPKIFQFHCICVGAGMSYHPFSFYYFTNLSTVWMCVYVWAYIRTWLKNYTVCAIMRTPSTMDFCTVERLGLEQAFVLITAII